MTLTVPGMVASEDPSKPVKRFKKDAAGRFCKWTPEEDDIADRVFDMDKALAERPIGENLDRGLSKRTDQFFRDRAERAKQALVAALNGSVSVGPSTVTIKLPTY